MEYNTKLEICRMRIDNKSIYEIAETVSVFPQSVHLFIKTFPKENGARPMLPLMPKDEMLEICILFINGRSIEEISEEKNVKKEDIMNIFSFMTARKTTTVKSTRFPKIAMWLNERGWSIKLLSEKTGIELNALKRMLSGSKAMDADSAQRISNVTGLTFSDIFEYHMKNHIESSN